MNATLPMAENRNVSSDQPADAATRFLQQMEAVGILSPSAVRALIDDGTATTPDACLKELVRRDPLTAFQSRIISRFGVDALVFGRYVVLDEIGRGGIGRVFKVYHRGLKRVAALKVLARKHACASEFVRRFSRETVAAARLDHPNITMAFDAGCSKRRPYLVMEFVEGKDLARLVSSNGPFPWRPRLTSCCRPRGD